MKILLFGAQGQLGRQLQRSLSVQADVVELSRASTGACGDLADRAGLARTVRDLLPDVIVNAAAYTAVDRAESEPDLAFAINRDACATLAIEAQRIGAWLVHYSTEYVFDGGGSQAWRESDPTAPLNVYGRSKLAGEQEIARHCERHLILRTSWLYDCVGQNFLKAILGAALVRDRLEVVNDQWGAATRATWVADVTASLVPRLQAQHAGIYHLAAGGQASRHAYAVYILQCARQEGLAVRVPADQVHAVSTVPKPGVAARPANSRMDSSLLCEQFGITLPPWEHGVEAVVRELAAGYMLPR